MSDAAPLFSDLPTSVPGKHASHGARDEFLRVAQVLASDGARGGSSRHFAVAHISIAEVARAAGVSRGALYRLWPSQQDFRTDLVDYILASAHERLAARGVASDARSTIRPSHGIPVGTVMDDTQDVLLADPLPLLRAAVVSYPEPSATAQVLDGRPSTATASLDRRVGAEPHHNGSRGIGGVTTSDVTAAVIAIGNGLPITGRMTPPHELTFDSPAFAAQPDEPRSLLGVMTTAIQARLTEADRAPGAPGAPSSTDTPPAARPGSLWVAPLHVADLSRVQRTGSTDTHPGRREHYLQIAASLALGAAAPEDHDHVLGHVSLDALARAANVTRRTLTNVWPDQAQFRLDLFSHLLELERERAKDAVTETTTEAGAASLDADEAFLALGDRIHAEVTAHLDEITFLAYAPQLDQRIVAQRALHDHNRHLDDCALLLRRLLSATNRRPCPGVSLRQIALVLFTLSDGINRLSRTHRALAHDEITSSGRHHSLTGHIAAAILDRLTEPIDTHSQVVRLAALLS